MESGYDRIELYLAVYGRVRVKLCNPDLLINIRGGLMYSNHGDGLAGGRWHDAAGTLERPLLRYWEDLQ